MEIRPGGSLPMIASQRPHCNPPGSSLQLIGQCHVLKSEFGCRRHVPEIRASGNGIAFNGKPLESITEMRAARVSISTGFGPPRTPRNRRKIPVFGRPKIVKNFTFWLSTPTFKPGFGTGMAEKPRYFILRSRG